MNKIIAIIIIALVVGGSAYYFLFRNDSSRPAIPASPSSGVAGTVVSIRNFSFNPAELAVTTGATVTWTNNDSVAHTVTSDAPDLFDSRTLTPGQSFSYTFSSTGSIVYHCAIHPMMKGAISVAE